MPPCDCFEWKYLARYFDAVGVGELAAPLMVAAVLVIAGIAGAVGLLARPVRVAQAALARPGRAVSRNARLRWALAIATLVWSAPFLYGCSLALRPAEGALPLSGVLGAFIMAAAAAASMITALVLWFLMWAVARVRGRRAAKSDQLSA
jgi:hypothetical protein